jgi:superfamily II DNA or RNA helicase
MQPSTAFCFRGYSIKKAELTSQQARKLTKDLTIQPKMIGAPLFATIPSFPAYRENTTKWFVPKYYGLREFGTPKVLPNWMLQPPPPLSGLVFAGELRPHQHVAVEAYVQACQPIWGGGGVLKLPCAFGKTTIGCYLMCNQHLLRKDGTQGGNGRVMVIVHMEFLLKQWMERIQQFIPTAKVGRIQGETMDVEGKDVVLCMLKSLAEKDYPTSLFNGVEMLICDEVHHFSSRTFSNSLFKLSPRFTLGLSATPERQDGTTHLFLDMLGPILIDLTNQGDALPFEIRKILYTHPDEEYNKVITDFMGNTQISSMLSKISKFEPRTEFLMRVIQDYLLEDPNTQLMAIGHNLSLLEHMYTGLPQLGVSSVGKYVGGSKERKHLKSASEKQVILATYKMASEGLDIPTLSSMIMVSPKKDIVQVIGRITRVKRPKYIVYDIVDAHACFQNQWRHRRRYYRSQGFQIYESTSKNYTGKWQTCSSTDADTDEAADDDADDTEDADEDEPDEGGERASAKSASAKSAAKRALKTPVCLIHLPPAPAI